MSDTYQPKHAAPLEQARLRAAARASIGYTPRHAASVVVVRYTGHGLPHGTYRPDVRVGGVPR